MSGRQEETSRDPRFAAWIGVTLVLFVFSIGVGFVWLPSGQRGGAALDLWASICRAVGLPGTNAASGNIFTGPPASTLAWTSAMRAQLTRGNAQRGATLAAATCNNCHGANGISNDAAFPNLAGQSVGTIYKQLIDFKTGKRNATVMGVFVDPLSQQGLLDLATHFASLAGPSIGTSLAQTADATGAARLIEVGDPMRGITSCAACHGPLGLVPGAPMLQGQQRAYLEEQLLAFKAGSRHNDINAQMRSVARSLSFEEISALAAQYAGPIDKARKR